MGLSSGDLFKSSLDKAFSGPGMKLNADTMTDAMKFKQGMKEEDTEDRGISDLDKNKQGMVYGIAEILRKIEDVDNRKKIAKDMITKFKREKIKFDYNKFLDICELGKNKKEEPKEATGSGSSGAYSGPVFGGDDSFWERSNSEKAKIKEDVGELEKIETKEATGSGSVGGYSSPAMWAKSTKKKDWGPSRKTQVPGGKFVSVKKKCTKFPYCNQGDIKALNISKNESVKEAIKNISKKLNINENVIISILEHEYEMMNKRVK